MPMRPKNYQAFMKKKLVPRPEQRMARPPMKPKPFEGKVVKEEPKKQEAVKKNEKSPRTPEKSCGGHYELNSFMTRMVDAELKDIMTKVWQVLPDSPSTETECIVVDTLRNKAGDDLRNVLGLNVTSRLLNVYNPLLIKVRFNGKPQKEELREFLRKYHFTMFARKAVNIFAAKVRTIEDYDKLCADNNVRCGSVKVTVSPVYNFTSCPPNLKTSYKDMSIENKSAASNDAKMNIGNKVDHNNKEKNESQKIVSQNVPSKVKEETSKAGYAQSKLNIKSLEKTQEAKKPIESPNKPVQNTRKTEIVKPEPPKIIKTETKIINQTKSETKVTPQKVATKVASTDAAPPIPSAEVTPTKETPNEATHTKVATSKDVAPTAVRPTKTTAAQVVSPKKVTPTTAPPAKATPTKDVSPTKKAPTKVISPTKATKTTPKKATKVENDYDELDDHDILALMSEGIILDECSGSDEE